MGQRRRHERVGFVSDVVVLLDNRHGLITTRGHILDLSLSGCRLHVHREPHPGDAGRVELTVVRTRAWLPIVVRWRVISRGGWVFGAEFDRPTPEKQALIRRAVTQRQGLTALK